MRKAIITPGFRRTHLAQAKQATRPCNRGTFLRFACLSILSTTFACAQTPDTYDALNDLATSNLRGLKKTGVVVADLDADVAKIGVSEEELRTDTEERLKKSGISIVSGKARLENPGQRYLYVEVVTRCDPRMELCGVNIGISLIERVILEPRYQDRRSRLGSGESHDYPT